MISQRPSRRQQSLIDWVADCYGVTAEQIRAHNNRQPETSARHVCMFLFNEVGKLSLGQTGRIMGGFHHTTVKDGRDNIRELALKDSRIDLFIEGAQQLLGCAASSKREAFIAEPKPIPDKQAA